MTISPMRPWQNALAIAAAFLVAGALLPWELRIACAVGAIGIVLLLGVTQMSSRNNRVTKTRIADTYGQIEAIRTARKKRYPGRGASRLR
jgi:hypothetical protein